MQYVGKTIQKLRDCFRAHLSNIGTRQSTNVARHLNSLHGSDTLLVQVQIIEKVRAPLRAGNALYYEASY